MSDELNKLYQELDSKIPRDVVSERDGGGGRKLSYLEGHYVIDRLNKVFGNLGWSNTILDVREVKNTTSRGEFPAYLVKVRLEVVFVDPSTNLSRLKVSEGYGYGADKSSQNAHELAIKEAVTDALKVAAKNLGMSLGLALYDKTQEMVDDGPEPSKKEKPSRTEPVAQSNKETSGATESPDRVKEVIRANVRAAIKKGAVISGKTLTMDLMKDILKKDFGAESLDDIEPSKYEGILNLVRGFLK